MKIAIQLAGQMRDWDTQREFFSYVRSIKPDYVEVLDFFLATWDEGVYVDTTLFKKVHFKQPIDTISLYKMADRWQRVTTLRNDYEEETGIQYDIVIHTRPDAIFTDPFKAIDKIKSVEDKTNIRFNPRSIFVPSGIVFHPDPNFYNLQKSHYYNEHDKPDEYIFIEDHVLMGHPLSIDVLGTLSNAFRRKVVERTYHLGLAEWLVAQRQIVYPLPINTSLSRRSDWKEYLDSNKK